MNTKTEIFWETQDPHNHGWAFRAVQTDEHGDRMHEESGGIEGPAAKALDCINAGYEPNADDLAVLHRDFPDAEFIDTNGIEVGPLFPAD